MKDNQYFPYQDMKYVRPAFEDLLIKDCRRDYIDLGMIHYIESEEEWEQINIPITWEYVIELKNTGVIRHIGMIPIT